MSTLAITCMGRSPPPMRLRWTLGTGSDDFICIVTGNMTILTRDYSTAAAVAATAACFCRWKTIIKIK